MSSEKIEADTIDLFDKWCRDETLGVISAEQQIHKPVWECGGERFSEFESFFLIMIQDTPGITVNDLQRLWGRTQGAVSQRLISFERKGMIYKKKSDEDKRYTEVLLTDKGRYVCEKVRRLKRQHAKDAVDVLIEHGYSYEDLQKWLEMYQILNDYGEECRKRVWKM